MGNRCLIITCVIVLAAFMASSEAQTPAIPTQPAKKSGITWETEPPATPSIETEQPKSRLVKTTPEEWFGEPAPNRPPAATTSFDPDAYIAEKGLQIPTPATTPTITGLDPDTEIVLVAIALSCLGFVVFVLIAIWFFRKAKKLGAQRTIVIVGCLLVTAMTLIPPYKDDDIFEGWGFIFDPSYGRQIDFTRYEMQIIGVVLVTVGLAFAFREKAKEKEKGTASPEKE